MKYLLVGDFHGADLSPISEIIDQENVDVILSTPDFDTLETVLQFMEIERELNARGGYILAAPGNHDHAIIAGFSITRDGQTSNLDELHDKIRSDDRAIKYLTQLVYRGETSCINARKAHCLDHSNFGETHKTILVHGGYRGEIPTNISTLSDNMSGLNNLWARLKTRQHFLDNFAVMGEKGYSLMIRGHDHDGSPNPIFAIQQESGETNIHQAPHTQPYSLLPGAKCIINHGSLFNGEFVLIDTAPPDSKIPTLRYCRI